MNRTGPQHTRMLARLALPVRSERAMTLLDWLREYGPMSLDELRQVLDHSDTKAVRRYVTDLVEEGLVEVRPRACASSRRRVRNEYVITERGGQVY